MNPRTIENQSVAMRTHMAAAVAVAKGAPPDVSRKASVASVEPMPPGSIEAAPTSMAIG